jgi:hypothetical protein
MHIWRDYSAEELCAANGEVFEVRMKAGVRAGLIACAAITLWVLSSPAAPAAKAQVSGATATPAGPYIECCLNSDFVNIRSGPSVEYASVGVLVTGQTAEAIGRSTGGDWIEIRYTAVTEGVAWVYAPIVRLFTLGDVLRIIEPPPTATPRVTPTIDPTFAAQFSSVLPTRLPTFTPATPPTPVSIAANADAAPRGFPPALLIIGLAVAGLLGALASNVFGRR